MRNTFLLIMAINWLINDIRVECAKTITVSEQAVTINPNTYGLIKRKLTVLGVFNESTSVNNFNQKSTKKAKHSWRTPEICKLNDVIGKMEPEDNPCNIVAVYLSLQGQSTETLTLSKNYSPYECFKMTVNNVKSKVLGIKPRKKVMYCPPTTILLPSNANGNTVVRLSTNQNSFLIGRGDYRRNSIRVYRFNQGGKSMNLIHYMYDVLTYLEIQIETDAYMASRTKHTQKNYTLNGLRTAEEKYIEHRKNKAIVRNPSNKKSCEKTVEENLDACVDLAVFKIATSDTRAKNSFLLNFTPNAYYPQMNTEVTDVGREFVQNALQLHDTEFVDKSGFLAYVCVNRPAFVRTTVYKQDMIFCPQQIIIGINDKKTYRQPGFFYSTDLYEDSYFIYDVKFRQTRDSMTNGRADIAATTTVTDAEQDFQVFEMITLNNYVTWNSMIIPFGKKNKKAIEQEINSSD